MLLAGEFEGVPYIFQNIGSEFVSCTNRLRSRINICSILFPELNVLLIHCLNFPVKDIEIYIAGMQLRIKHAYVDLFSLGIQSLTKRPIGRYILYTSNNAYSTRATIRIRISTYKSSCKQPSSN